jgi:hypothetical protein
VKKSNSLSWRPVRRGDIYCSPACGRGCTWKEYEEAWKLARHIAKQLPGFKPCVHENLGWHARAEALDGHITVSKSCGSYLALADNEMTHAGDADWGTANGATAKKAVNALLRQLARHVDGETAFLRSMNNLPVVVESVNVFIMELSYRLVTMILRAAKTYGTFNPDEIMPSFEEDLLLSECDVVEEFLGWVHVNGKRLGHRNIQDEFVKFRRDRVRNGILRRRWRAAKTGKRAQAKAKAKAKAKAGTRLGK